MPAQRLPWIKFWPELFDHEKFAALSDSEAWTWVVVWGKASLQAKRWRFASVEHAQKVTGRPVKHIRRLIEVRLLDDTPEGLLIHDARPWQDPSKLTPTQREPSLNGDGTVAEDTPNGDGTMTNSGPNADLEGEGDRDIEGDVDVEREKTKTNNPPAPKGAAPPGNPKVRAVIDAFRALGIDPVLSARDHAAIKASNAEAELVAEVYDAVARREYGDDFMRRRLSVHEAIEWCNGYTESKAQHLRQPPTGFEGQSGCPGCHKANWDVSFGPLCPMCVKRKEKLA